MTLREAAQAFVDWDSNAPPEDCNHTPYVEAIRAALAQEEPDWLMRVHGGRHLRDDTDEHCPECWVAAFSECARLCIHVDDCALRVSQDDGEPG